MKTILAVLLVASVAANVVLWHSARDETAEKWAWECAARSTKNSVPSTAYDDCVKLAKAQAKPGLWEWKP